ncbi:helix-turn-helix transcriptional regulator [Roseomonas marmotae]|uniref:Helix-turn-helix transcriptional regulator n=1 Tax=Roseomonas marmotae TaxID=2768161 RepID=A0ABS3K7T2_9PROT|nr:helix-turn-helix transcriptional regulator [Roseomonas marmotae]MBO1073531.1 helix-turn-helix transcriptional regulator [Roseomonas marmotae]QTI80282.1 helix-turn-helix transcriptional regulator [Roseomonas marmotae]
MERLTDLIYEAALDPAGWQSVFEALSGLTGARGATLFNAGPGPVRWMVSPGLEEMFHAFVTTKAWDMNDRAARGIARHHAGFLGDQHLYTPEELARSRFHREFLHQHGLGWCAGTVINPPSGDQLILTVERGRDDGPVPETAIAKLDILRPHLARAALLSARLRLERANAAVVALEMLGLPAAMISAAGRGLAINSFLAELVPAVLQDRQERLVLSNRIADLSLTAALMAMRTGDGSGPRSIPLPATQERPPMVAHLVPVRGAARDVFSQAMALLVLTPVRHGTVVAAEVIQGLFDLTPAEARVAHGIGTGRTAEELARSLGISVETIRKHIAAVLTKTGLPRQAALVGLLAGSIPPGQR